VGPKQAAGKALFLGRLLLNNGEIIDTDDGRFTHAILDTWRQRQDSVSGHASVAAAYCDNHGLLVATHALGSPDPVLRLE
jgi:hypothetical protein